ncbi:hypothetical protein GCM10022408_36200 [Hymenobacter fastidiosus]|uniref:Thioredoxin domain-containing protein n=1 Tax=Hymenobacter fastidiosus TaxID=486264 RepID=A0ABP7T075_9BACT
MAYSIRIPGLVVAVLLATAPLASRAQGTVTLTGKVSGKTADSVAVSIRENLLDPKEHIIYAAVSDRGEFRLAVKVNGPTRADLVYDDDVADLFLEPGMALEIKFKGNDLAATIRYKGKGAEPNTYLADVDERFNQIDGFQVLPENIMFYEPGFLTFLDYRRKEQRKFYESTVDGESYSRAFRDYATAEIDYSYANDRLTYQDLREQVVATEGRLKMTPTYYDFLNEKTLINNPAALNSELHQEFLLNYVHYMVTTSGRPRTDPSFYQACYDLAKSQLTGPTRPIVMGRVLQESFRFGHVKQSAAMLQDFRAADPRNEYYPVLTQDFETHKAFAIGAPAPNFHFLTATGDSVSLQSFAGKLIYINFWRTTSGLALRDLPYAADLIKKFDGKNIVFLNVALDENEPAWKQLVIGKKLPGIHVRAAGGMRSAMAKAYALQDVPAYFLLAEDGTFLNTKPKRLSSRAAVDEIKQSFGKASTYSSTMPAANERK